MEEVKQVLIGKLGNALRHKELSLLFVIIVGSIALVFASPNFLNIDNILAVFLAASFESIVAIGMTLLLISGGFDLSVGSVYAFGGVISGILLTHG
jgi:ribose transport system permease protein